MQPSSRCGAVLVGLALLAIVPKFCFGQKGKAMGVHLVCMLNDFFNSWSSRLIRPVKLNALLTVTVTWLMVPRGLSLQLPKYSSLQCINFVATCLKHFTLRVLAPQLNPPPPAYSFKCIRARAHAKVPLSNAYMSCTGYCK